MLNTKNQNYKTSFAGLVVILSATFLLAFTPIKAQAFSLSDVICTGTIMDGLFGLAKDAIGNVIGGKVKGVIGGAVGKITGGLGIGSVTGVNAVPVLDDGTNKKLAGANKYQSLIDCAQENLHALNQSYVKDFVNGVLGNYTITNYLNYGKNLAYTVYVADQLKNADQEDELIIRANIQRMLDSSTPTIDLEPLYQRRAIASVDFTKLRQTADYSSAPYESILDPLVSTPFGQQLSSENTSQRVLGEAQGAASQSLANGQGKKDAFECKLDSDSGKTLCAVKYPGQYITSQIDSKINSLFGEQVKPQRNVAAINEAFRQFRNAAIKKLSDEIFDSAKKSSTTILR